MRGGEGIRLEEGESQSMDEVEGAPVQGGREVRKRRTCLARR